MGLVISWWSSDPVRLAAGAVMLGEKSSLLELKRGLWEQGHSVHVAVGRCGLRGQRFRLQNGSDAACFTNGSRGGPYPTPVPLASTTPASAVMVICMSLPEDILWLQEHVQPPHSAVWKLGELRCQKQPLTKDGWECWINIVAFLNLKGQFCSMLCPRGPQGN